MHAEAAHGRGDKLVILGSSLVELYFHRKVHFNWAPFIRLLWHCCKPSVFANRETSRSSEDVNNWQTFTMWYIFLFNCWFWLWSSYSQPTNKRDACWIRDIGDEAYQVQEQLVLIVIFIVFLCGEYWYQVQDTERGSETICQTQVHHTPTPSLLVFSNSDIDEVDTFIFAIFREGLVHLLFTQKN